MKKLDYFNSPEQNDYTGHSQARDSGLVGCRPRPGKEKQQRSPSYDRQTLTDPDIQSTGLQMNLVARYRD